MCAKWSISMAWPGPESPSGPHMVNMCGLDAWMHGLPAAGLLPTLKHPTEYPYKYINTCRYSKTQYINTRYIKIQLCMKLPALTQMKSHNYTSPQVFHVHFKILPIKIAVSPQILLHLVNYYRYHVVLPPNPVCELGSKGEHNCMLKRLRNGHPVLLNLCFLCGLIVETCSHAVL